MKWLSVKKDGLPKYNEKVLTFSKCYKDNPDKAFRLMNGQFVRICIDVTHYIYPKDFDIVIKKEVHFQVV